MRAEASIPSVPSSEPGSAPSAGRVVRRHAELDAGGERIVEFVAPRVVGPGRLERGYQARIARERERAAELECELELARLVERGAQRRLDRIEAELGAARGALDDARSIERRLCAAIGALQAETARLAAELQQRATARLPGARRSLLARWLRLGR